MIRENCCFYQPPQFELPHKADLIVGCLAGPSNRVGNERRLHSDKLHSLIMCLLLPFFFTLGTFPRYFI